MLATLRAQWRALARRLFPVRRYVAHRIGLRPPAGVNLVAPIREETGQAEAARGIAAALAAAGIPFNIVNCVRPGHHVGDTTWRHKETLTSGYDITLVCGNADVTGPLQATVPSNLFNNRYVIGSWWWELADFPDRWLSAFLMVDEVWAGSRFTQAAFAAKSPVPVVHISPSVAVPPFEPLPRKHFGLPDDRFLFLFSCDMASNADRKNPMAVVQAFRRAFPSDAKPAGLVLKVINSAKAPVVMAQLLEAAGGRSDIRVVDHVMPRNELSALMALADCYVSLHRSEGFGLGPAEAMSLGKPVMVTNWSGNTDYMTPANSIAIDYRLIRLESDNGPYLAGQLWADPDVDQAAHWMTRLVNEPELARRIGEAGRETMAREYSPAAVGALIQRRLDYIRRVL